MADHSVPWEANTIANPVRAYAVDDIFRLVRRSDEMVILLDWLKAELQTRDTDRYAALLLSRACARAISDRRQASRVNLQLAPLDDQFRTLFAEAETYCHQELWGEGEYAFWRAFQLYPHHYPAIIRYSTCLLKQRKLLDAELWFRSAAALGAPCDEVVRDYLVAVRDRDGAAKREMLTAVARTYAENESENYLGWPPTVPDVKAIMALLWGRGASSLEELARYVMLPTRGHVIDSLMQHSEFVRRNLDLLRVVADRDAEERLP